MSRLFVAALGLSLALCVPAGAAEPNGDNPPPLPVLGPGASQPDPEAAREALARGVQAFRTDRDLEAFWAAVDAWRAGGSLEALELAAVSALQVGNVSLADAAYGHLAAHPETPAEMRRRARNQVTALRRQTGRLRVEVRPTEASLFVDGHPVGALRTLALLPGRHLISASAAGHLPTSRHVSATLQVESSLVFELRPDAPPPPVVPEPPAGAPAEVAQTPAPPPASMPGLDVTRAELDRLRAYHAYAFDTQSDKQIARTYPNRHSDQIRFLQAVRNARTGPLAEIARAFFAEGGAAVFVDIGPGLANLEAPAITSREMAVAFPGFTVVALDLPAEVEKFHTVVGLRLRRALTALPNLRIIAGDGLQPLPPQLPAGLVAAGAPLLVRAANSIEIYCDPSASLGAVVRIAADYEAHPALLFFNREILFKPAGAQAWRLIGQVSERGFQHRRQSFPADIPPFELSPAFAAPQAITLQPAR